MRTAKTVVAEVSACAVVKSAMVSGVVVPIVVTAVPATDCGVASEGMMPLVTSPVTKNGTPAEFRPMIEGARMVLTLREARAPPSRLTVVKRTTLAAAARPRVRPAPISSTSVPFELAVRLRAKACIVACWPASGLRLMRAPPW